jgi:hypothetical protein
VGTARKHWEQVKGRVEQYGEEIEDDMEPDEVEESVEHVLRVTQDGKLPSDHLVKLLIESSQRLL